MKQSFIEIIGANEHNLKNVSARIPRDALTVVTGVSGSGKSTLAFDILFSSGQARFLECVNAYARQFIQPQAKADYQALKNLPPTVAIEQRLSQGGWKSTVATATEIYNSLRLLFLTLGEQRCPRCDVPVTKQPPEQIAEQLFRQFKGKKELTLLARLVDGRKGTYEALALDLNEKGYETVRLDGVLVPTHPWKKPGRFKEHTIDLPVAAFSAAEKPGFKTFLEAVRKALSLGKGYLRVRFDKAPEFGVSTDRVCPQCHRSFEDPDPRLFSFHSARGRCPACNGFGFGADPAIVKNILKAETGSSAHITYHTRGASFDQQLLCAAEENARADGERLREISFAEAAREEAPEDHDAVCPVCGGVRLRAEARAFRFRNLSIGDFTKCSVQEISDWFDAFTPEPREAAIADGILRDLRSRLSFLRQVGLGYLTLDRAVPTLSGGEAQRIRLAAQLGSNLCGVCYVLDEPTIGLHPRDTSVLLDTLCALREKGNTVVMVEHDEQTMRRADWICDLGPGAGREGGELLVQGPLSTILKNKVSKTAFCLSHPLKHPTTGHCRPLQNVSFLTVHDAFLHNLQHQDVQIPLERFTVVTGVSGSGKSTLVRNVLYESLAPLTGGGKPRFTGCARISGWEKIRRVLEVDQAPIGRTPRSCPATYVSFWNHIRTLFASVPEARMRGWGAERFSFNLPGGRCPACEGQGCIRSEMAFMPDVVSPCEDCHGTRFTPETLLVRWNGKNIAEVLNLSIAEALKFFHGIPAVTAPLQLLCDVGLGYLSLGQQSSTLSGGEAQRIKLVTELARCTPKPGIKTPRTLYILDEPTVGLHAADITHLLRVIHRLVDAGHTVVMIEHNTDMMLDADYLIDLGPGGGTSGGKIVTAGPLPELLADPSRDSATLRILRPLCGV